MTTKLIKVDDYWAVVENKSDVLLFSQNPKHNLPSITFSDEVAKELGIVDVEKLKEKQYDSLYERLEKAKNFRGQVAGRHPDLRTSQEIHSNVEGYLEGYNQCLSNNTDKKFTLDDIKKAIDLYV